MKTKHYPLHRGQNKMTNYKQLAEDLYEVLKKFRCGFIINPEIDNAIQKYEELTTRRTGRTTALYMKAITEALENLGKSVEFIDHYPHNWEHAKQHEDALKMIKDVLSNDEWEDLKVLIKESVKWTKPLTYEEMIEIASQREKENAFEAMVLTLINFSLDRLYNENGEALRRLATEDSHNHEPNQ